MKLKATVNFRAINRAYRRGQRGIVLPGGTRSAKTVSAVQWIVLYCLQNTGKEIAICRDTMANLKRTVLKDLIKICYGQGEYEHALYPTLHINKTDWNCKINGNTVWFFGLKDDPMRVHGFDSDIFYINEMISTYKNTFDQLEQRCREFWLGDLNPSEPNSWVYQLEKRDDVDFFRTTFKDNPFLTPAIIRKILSYEPTDENVEMGTADKRKWSIYGCGEVYKGAEIIIQEWKPYTDEEEPEGYDYLFYGLDWGWNDPLAFMKVIVDGRRIYIRELLYGSEITKEEYTARIMDEEPLTNHEAYLVCDSSEPKSINELRAKNIPAMAAKKPKGSIMDGIRMLNGYEILIHEDSHNAQYEANNYKYKIDEKTDTVLDIPIDKDNHSWDAVRYPLQTFLK